MNTLPQLEPGIYENIAPEIYFALPYFSNSRGTLLKRSPAHLRADIENPRESTDAQRIGTAIHAAVLEPVTFMTRYVSAGSCAALLKSGDRKGMPCGATGKQCHDGVWFCDKHPHPGTPDNVVAISPADYMTCLGVRESVFANPRLRRLLEAPGRAELTVIWDDDETGVRCKARIDFLCESFGGVIVDLKSTTDARPQVFEKKLFEYGYYRQSGFYRGGLRTHGIETKHLVIAAAEKTRPYAVAGFRLTDAAVDAGYDETRVLLARYAECERTGVWPAYDEKINEISLPAWAWDKLEEVAA